MSNHLFLLMNLWVFEDQMIYMGFNFEFDLQIGSNVPWTSEPVVAGFSESNDKLRDHTFWLHIFGTSQLIDGLYVYSPWILALLWLLRLANYSRSVTMLVGGLVFKKTTDSNLVSWRSEHFVKYTTILLERLNEKILRLHRERGLFEGNLSTISTKTSLM